MTNPTALAIAAIWIGVGIAAAFGSTPVGIVAAVGGVAATQAVVEAVKHRNFWLYRHPETPQKH